MSSDWLPSLLAAGFMYLLAAGVLGFALGCVYTRYRIVKQRAKEARRASLDR